MSILTIVGFFANLFNIGGFVDWVVEIFYKALLFFDGLAYLLLAYSFKVFQLMCTLNFNSLYGLISGVLTRIEALIMVFVVYKLGISLITFMLNPEEAAKKGKEILINIFITAALLLSYNTIFTLFNELCMLIIGTPDNYNYVVLGQIAEVTGGADTGLINRVVFGTDEQIPDVGEYIAFSVCSTFITDTKDPQNTAPLNRELSNNGHIDFMKLQNIANKIGKSYDYFPVVGFIGAVYMIYSFIKTTIQVGVRAFKLLILQVLAPVAIITIIGEGVKGKTFKNFLNKYISVYIEVFIRMFSMLLICNFVVKFIRNITDYFPSINSDEWYTIALMILLLLVAAFKFAGDIPKFIDEILNTHLGDGKKFGNFVGGLLGAGLGAVGGFVGGVAGGGIGAGFAGLAKGAVQGAQSGAKGNSVAEFFKGQNQVRKDAKAAGQNIAAKGGLFQTGLGAVQGAVGVGDRQDKAVAKIDKQQALLDQYDKDSAQELKQMSATAKDLQDPTKGHFATDAGYTSAYTAAQAQFNSAGFENVKMSSKDEYQSKMREYNEKYRQAAARVTAAENGTYANNSNKKRAVAKARLELAQAAKESDDASGALYDASIAALARKEGTHTHALDQQYRKMAGGKVQENDAGGIHVKKETAGIASRRHQITDRASYARTHGQNPKNK